MGDSYTKKWSVRALKCWYVISLCV